MARLRPCKDCGHEVSKSAEACPNCGRRYRRRWNEIGPFTKSLLWFVLILFVVAIFVGCAGS